MGISGSEIKRERERAKKATNSKSFSQRYKEAAARNALKDAAKQPICANCGYQGNPKKATKGSLLVEIAAWLLFLLPGLIYSLWRLSSKYDSCPSCGAPNMIPANSPVAQKTLNGG